MRIEHQWIVVEWEKEESKLIARVIFCPHCDEVKGLKQIHEQ